MHEAWVEWRAGDQDAEERVLREGIDEADRLGGHAYFPTAALFLADCVYSQGRLDEAERLCAWARDSTGADDLINFIYLEGLEAVMLARRGRHEEAEEPARRAVELAETTDLFDVRAWAPLLLAETLALGDRSVEAAKPASQALAIHEAKGDVTGAARAREPLAKLGIAVAA